MLESDVTKVMYRVFQGTVVALFPEELGNMDVATCLSYSALGQHSAANVSHVIKGSRPAKESEYTAVHDELTQGGYVLEVVSRHTKSMIATRQAKLSA